MQAEIVMIGTELLLGQIVDTNAAFLGRVLAENGVNLYHKTTVGDNRARIIRVLDQALDRAEVVLTSGGLGPTEDDLTRDCIAELTGRPLEFRQELLEQLAARFATFRRPMAENNKRQAYAPRGAHAIANPNGTAPGLIVEEDRGVIIAMPGVPRELEAMLVESVIPFLRERYGLHETLCSRVLKVCGVGESSVDAAIADIINSADNPKIGLLASPDAVKIRLSARADSTEQAEALIAALELRVRDRLPGLIMGVDEDTLEVVVDRLLAERRWRIALGETHTGGTMAQLLTSANARTFAGGEVTPLCLLQESGFHRDAAAWAESLRARFGASAVLAASANPATQDVTAVFVSPEGTVEWNLYCRGMDQLNQLRSSVICLEQLRRHLTGYREPLA